MAATLSKISFQLCGGFLLSCYYSLCMYMNCVDERCSEPAKADTDGC